MDHIDIAQLIVNCRVGDRLSIEKLISYYQKSLYRLALSILDDPAEADEAAQDAFVAALDALDSYRGESAFNTWLYAITLNICRDRLRRRRTWERLKQTLRAVFQLKGEDPVPPEETILRNEADAALWEALQSLDEKHRLPMILRYYHDFPIAEIAQILRINEGTVHSRLYTARERLRVVLNIKGLPINKVKDYARSEPPTIT